MNRDWGLIAGVLIAVGFVVWTTFWTLRCRERVPWVTEIVSTVQSGGVLPPIYFYCSERQVTAGEEKDV